VPRPPAAGAARASATTWPRARTARRPTRCAGTWPRASRRAGRARGRCRTRGHARGEPCPVRELGEQEPLHGGVVDLDLVGMHRRHESILAEPVVRPSSVCRGGSRCRPVLSSVVGRWRAGPARLVRCVRVGRWGGGAVVWGCCARCVAGGQAGVGRALMRARTAGRMAPGGQRRVLVRAWVTSRQWDSSGSPRRDSAGLGATASRRSSGLAPGSVGSRTAAARAAPRRTGHGASCGETGRATGPRPPRPRRRWPGPSGCCGPRPRTAPR